MTVGGSPGTETERRHRRYAPRMAAADRREQLLDAALTVIVEQGYAHVSMEAIARTAGVTRPVVYGQFPSLRHLLEELVEREERESVAQLAEVLPARSETLHPAEVLAECVRRFLAIVASRPDTWTLILLPLEGTPEVVRKHVRAQRERMLERMEAVVRWGIGQSARETTEPVANDEAARGPGAARAPAPAPPADIDVELAARAILGLAEDAGRMVLTDPERYPPDRYERFVGRIMSLLWP